MFENIINQNAINYLIMDIENKKIPHSILFSGPENSGKMTTALEFARVVSCEKNADWSCNCNSCDSMRHISTTDLLVIGSKDLVCEIKASAKTFLTSETTGSYFLFTRSVKKLLLRFDQRLWDLDENRFVKASTLVSDSQHLLNELPLTLKNEKKRTSTVEKIIDFTEKIQDTCMYETIPVNQVRKASSWIRLMPAGKYKFLIVENAERMQESARAAFLKILEEPPRHAFFILTSSRPAAILPTILSRVRPYNFLQRDLNSEKEILERVFHVKEIPEVNKNESILTRYFQNFLPVSFEKIKESALNFWACIFTNYTDKNFTALISVENFLKPFGQKEIKTISEILGDLKKGKDVNVFKVFLEQVVNVLQNILNAKNNLTALEVENFHKLTKTIQKWKTANNIYNLSEQAVLEGIAMEIARL